MVRGRAAGGDSGFKPLQNGAVLRSRLAHDLARRLAHEFQTPSKRGGTA